MSPQKTNSLQKIEIQTSPVPAWFRSRRQRLFWRYATAALLVGFAVWLRLTLGPDFGTQVRYVTLYPALVVVAFVLGAGPVVFSALVGLLAVEILLPAPHLAPLTRTAQALALLTVTALVAIFVNRQERLRRKHQGALRESEERLRLAKEASKLGIFDLNVAASTIHWDEWGLELWGIGPGEPVTIERFLAGLHPDDRKPTQIALAKALAPDGDGEFYAEYRVMFKGERWVAATGHMTFQEGNPVRLIGTMQDITERKQAEGALKRSEAMFRRVADANLLGVAICHLSGSLTYVNDEMLRMMGRTRQDLQTRTFSWVECLAPECLERGRDVAPVLRRDRRLLDQELAFVHPDGDRTPFLCAFALIGEGNESYVITALDLTAIRKAQKELLMATAAAEHARTLAEEANRAKDHFLAILSHELRTPLTPVLAGIACLDERNDLSGNAKETLEIMQRNIEMEARLIDDLLDINRIVRGKVELQKEVIDLTAIVQRAIEVCKPDLRQSDIHFKSDLNACSPSWVEGDPGRLQQVFWNLIKNAIKFTPRGGCVGVNCHLTNEGCLAIEITDSGHGIEPQALPHIFNAFEQAEASITRQFGGLGLGLAISRALVDLHGGSIVAESAGRGLGATFRVTLPLTQAARPSPRKDAGHEETAPSTSPARILLVEDHLDTAKVMEIVLSQKGYVVRTAGGVNSALDLANREHFDLLVSDLGLPDGSGYDLMRQLRSRQFHSPGIALSGYGQQEDIARSQAAGFGIHLTKPVSPMKLAETIASLLG